MGKKWNAKAQNTTIYTFETSEKERKEEKGREEPATFFFARTLHMSIARLSLLSQDLQSAPNTGYSLGVRNECTTMHEASCNGVCGSRVCPFAWFLAGQGLDFAFACDMGHLLSNWSFPPLAGLALSCLV